MKRLYGPRTTAKLSEPTNRRLNMYALAAGAAGVGVLALAQPVEAKIVYTPANVVIGYGGVGSYNLDLNHDGVTDVHFQMYAHGYNCGDRGWAVFRFFETAPSGNGVVGAPPAALNSGSKIGSRQEFYAGRGQMAFKYLSGCGHGGEGGNWLNASDRYLGLAFRIHGRTHYGWARLSVRYHFLHGLTATLTGYAYETISGRSIIAGKTKGPADEAGEGVSGTLDSPINPIPDTPQPASLGLLALGAQAVPLWRRKDPAVEGN
jgi:hypothetical protein